MELTSTVHGQVGAQVRWATQHSKLFSSNWAKGSRATPLGAESADDSGLSSNWAGIHYYKKLLDY
jgi:hypothetical protein